MPPNKHPAIQAQPVTAKKPRISLAVKATKATKEPVAESISWYDYYPCWRITHLEMCPPYGWHQIDPVTLAHIQNKLRCFESMTLSQIFLHAKKQNHGVKLYKLSPEARKRLGELGHDATIEELYTLRLAGRQRIWGIRECNTFQLLWWDPNHQVCPSLKD